MTIVLFLLAVLVPACAVGVGFWLAGKLDVLYSGFAFAASLVVAGSAYGLSTSLGYADSEYWTGFAQSISFKEDWTETKTEVVTDSKGRTHTEVRHVYHGPEYWVTDSNNIVVSVDKDRYVGLAKRFGAADPPIPGWFSGSGRTHEFRWPGDTATAEVVTTRHAFENRTQSNDSVFRYPDVTREEREQFGLYDWPNVEGHYSVPSVLGWPNPDDERRLSLLNARFGAELQVRVWVLVFPGQPPEASVLQEAYWKGGKKNELVVCYGVGAAGEVAWCRAFSWSESEQLKVDVQTVLPPGQPLELPKLFDWLEQHLPADWHRKQFHDFSYIQKEPPGWVVVLAAFLMAVASVLIVGIGLEQGDGWPPPRRRV